MEKQKFPVRELIFLIAGEVIVSLLIVGIYLLLDLFIESIVFSYKVILGVSLGSLITVLNFTVLSIMTGNVIDKIMAERGDGEKTDEEAAEFAETHKGKIQATMQLSFIIRTLVMLGTLVLAFITGVFDVIATLIPLLMLKPMLTISELTKKKGE